MGKLYDQLIEDVRFREGMKSCINCGTCTAICPAAEFYDYDPRKLANTVQTKDDKEIELLLKSETIWYCGECMSCKTRCPRGNTVGLIVMALRALSQKLGYFTESEKGRQQIVLKRVIGESIYNTGYCLLLKGATTEMYPEQGPNWDWEQQNWDEVFDKLGANYQKDGPGILRKIPKESMDEIHSIFEVTGGNKLFETIEKFSQKKAEEMGLELTNETWCEYTLNAYKTNNQKHTQHND
jgi:heterodisulfide reductase subunit C